MQVKLICAKCKKKYQAEVHQIFVLFDPTKAIKELEKKREADNGSIAFVNEVRCPHCSSHLYQVSAELSITLIAALLVQSAKIKSPNSDLENITIAEPMLGLLGKKMPLKEGKKILDKELKRNPTDPDLHLRYGCLMRWLNLYDVAIKRFLLAIKYNPNLEFAYYNLGQIYYAREEYEKAYPLFSKILTLSPKQERMKEILTETRIYLSDIQKRWRS